MLPASTLPIPVRPLPQHQELARTGRYPCLPQDGAGNRKAQEPSVGAPGCCADGAHGRLRSSPAAASAVARLSPPEPGWGPPPLGRALRARAGAAGGAPAETGLPLPAAALAGRVGWGQPPPRSKALRNRSQHCLGRARLLPIRQGILKIPSACSASLDNTAG